MNTRLDNPFTNGQIAQIYDRHSHEYHAYQKAFQTFKELVPLESRVLEIGVGTGAFTGLLLSAGYSVKGIDRSGEMLKRSSQRVRALSSQCDLLNYTFSGNYDIVVSHSGGFTFKQGKFETYYQEKENLERAFQKAHTVLGNAGIFLVNKAEHEPEINLGNGAIFTIKQEETGDSRIYTYTLQQDDNIFSKTQRRLVLTPAELQKVSSQYFNWNFDHEHWIIGKKI